MIEKSFFNSIDIEGVGALVELAFKKIEGRRSELIVGASGSHCADFESNSFLQKLGVNFISVPVEQMDFARLFSSQVLLHK